LDLEKHLPADWWRTLFNSLYLKTDGDVVENGTNTAREVDILIAAAGLEPNDHILDLCCGQGRHCLELARRGFRHLMGIDRSRYLVRLARRRARSLGLTVAFHEGDARNLRIPESSVHCVAIMGNSFGYFDREEDDLAVLQAARHVLVSGGTLAIDLADGEWMRDHYEQRSWEWIDQNHLVCRERSMGSQGDRLISREVIIHAERGIIADQFYAERLYSRERSEKLLADTGFELVRFHGPLAAESWRQQDLGMMAHRMFITAAAPRKLGRYVRGAPRWPEVTVILGDPSLPDGVKRDGRFNPEDMETIQRLKSAMAELDGYRFTYMENHANLIRQLDRSRPEFVLNLCDEGLRNDAFMEPHVAALLEALEIPYSGAGPVCLGLCYNKAIVRSVAMSLDIPVPLETYFDPADQSATLPSVFPALAKPNQGDSSLGITVDAVVNSPEELITYLQKVQEELPGRALLLQEFLSGPEYSVSIIGNLGLTCQVLPVLQVDYSQLDPSLPQILGYESKWLPDSPYWTDIRYHEAQIDEETRQQLSDWCSLLFERLGCRDYARFDWRADADGVVKLLEVNPNPGWCWDGKLNYMAGFAGLRYADLLRLILEAAQERVAAQLGPSVQDKAPLPVATEQAAACRA
jgi:D-alanine-D-alanine ligase